MLTIQKEFISVVDDQGQKTDYPIGSKEAFEILSQAWLRSGWDRKHVYSFAWLGRPIIQLPEDMFRIQEVIYKLKPDVIIETGVAHGGSLVFYASLCKAMNHGRVIGIDIDIRAHNRKAIEEHELFSEITLVEGSSIEPKTVEEVRKLVKPNETAIVIFDSNHDKDHVIAECKAYSEFVNVGSYLVVCDGIRPQLAGAPRSKEDWDWNHPLNAMTEFLNERDDFVCEEPTFPFNEGDVKERVTYWPDAFLKRVK